MPMTKLIFYGLLACVLGVSAGADAAGVVRHPIPDSNFPIAAAVEVPAGKTIIYLSGVVPRVSRPDAPAGLAAAYGDTRTQTIDVFESIQRQLESIGLGMGDVVKMQVFLVGDPDKGGRMDFSGFMEGYGQFFGTPKQPNLPARSTFQVAGLIDPGHLVEIEVAAVRP